MRFDFSLALSERSEGRCELASLINSAELLMALGDEEHKNWDLQVRYAGRNSLARQRFPSFHRPHIFVSNGVGEYGVLLSGFQVLQPVAIVPLTHEAILSFVNCCERAWLLKNSFGVFAQKT